MKGCHTRNYTVCHIETIQALLNFELRLRENIKMIVRFQKHNNLQKAIKLQARRSE